MNFFSDFVIVMAKVSGIASALVLVFVLSILALILLNQIYKLFNRKGGKK